MKKQIAILLMISAADAAVNSKSTENISTIPNPILKQKYQQERDEREKAVNKLPGLEEKYKAFQSAKTKYHESSKAFSNAQQAYYDAKEEAINNLPEVKSVYKSIETLRTKSREINSELSKLNKKYNQAKEEAINNLSNK